VMDRVSTGIGKRNGLARDNRVASLVDEPSPCARSSM
jgi:hypothetical protein